MYVLPLTIGAAGWPRQEKHKKPWAGTGSDEARPRPCRGRAEALGGRTLVWLNRAAWNPQIDGPTKNQNPSAFPADATDCPVTPDLSAVIEEAIGKHMAAAFAASPHGGGTGRGGGRARETQSKGRPRRQRTRLLQLQVPRMRKTRTHRQPVQEQRRDQLQQRATRKCIPCIRSICIPGSCSPKPVQSPR